MKKIFFPLLFLITALNLQANENIKENENLNFSNYMLENGFNFSSFQYEELSKNHLKFNGSNMSAKTSDNKLQYDINFEIRLEDENVIFENGMITNEPTNMKTLFSLSISKDSFEKTKSFPELIKRANTFHIEFKSNPNIFKTLIYTINEESNHESVINYFKGKQIQEKLLLTKENEIFQIRNLEYKVERDFSITLSTSIDFNNPTVLRNGNLKINLNPNGDLIKILKDKNKIIDNQIKIQLENTKINDIFKKISF